ncbi:alpha/beta fold hydrolase [Planctomonas psychrotolerans]|uniref:alpha/beta hydrolase n=1 Tax=Planctomonas psychrotolerans TaxID=2528712 RepID=UPI00123C547A|nr:alpha/beta hydrolase [Planctomonas psychrotolerans]
MPSTIRLNSGVPSNAPIALVLPGAGYTVQAPLLYWSALALTEAGWDVWSVDWHADIRAAGRQDPARFVKDALVQAIRELPSAPSAVIGKSVGSFALPFFLEHNVRGAWLTPILTDPRVAAAAQRASTRHLFVGGTADPLWRPEGTLPTSPNVIEVPEGNHSLEIPGAGWHRSAAAQLDVVRDIVAHLTDTR